MRKHIFAAILLLSFAFVPWLSVRAEDPWKFPEGFTPLPDSVARIEEHYIAALFVNPEKQLLALVIFNATCGSESCRVNHRAAYSVVNAEGSSIRAYVDPGEEELVRLIADKVVV